MPTHPLCLTVSMLIRAGGEDEALEHLRQLVIHTRREPGNLAYTVHRALQEPRRFFIYELYDDEAALEAHRASAHFAEHADRGLVPLVEERSAELYAAVAWPSER